jgi:hypothetical protein
MAHNLGVGDGFQVVLAQIPPLRHYIVIVNTVIDAF